jgi:ribosomal protein L12E/L44/L45/RPP1/RPP2
MAFVSKNVVVGQTPVQIPQEQLQEQLQQPNVELELSEVEFLLKVLKDANLKGYQVEMFYNMIVKLQTLYLKKSGRQ